MLKKPDVKNANKSKNRLTPAKLESKKHDTKALTSREGSGSDVPIELPIQLPDPDGFDFGLKT